MTKASVDYDLGLKEALTDPEEAAAYLNAALEDGFPDVFLLALEDVASARTLAHPVSGASPDHEDIRRILSLERGLPHLSGLDALLDSLGLKLAIAPKQVFV